MVKKEKTTKKNLSLTAQRSAIKKLKSKGVNIKEVYSKKGMSIYKVTSKGKVLKRRRKTGTQKRVVGTVIGIAGKSFKVVGKTARGIGKVLTTPKKLKAREKKIKASAKKQVKKAKAEVMKIKEQHRKKIQKERKMFKKLGMKEVYNPKGMKVFKVTKGGKLLKRKSFSGKRKRIVGVII